jgi:uncharacterized protein YdhG (YjbR/CyaY superfamily)
MSPTKKSAKPAASRDTSNEKWTKEELAAMKEHNREMKAAAANADGEQELLAKIAEMPAADRKMAERLHELVTANAPSLAPRTYYGMPAWAKDGKVVVFFQPASKFKSRYSTLGFNDTAMLDDGEMWATSWALKSLTTADEARIAALVKKAVS